MKKKNKLKTKWQGLKYWQKGGIIEFIVIIGLFLNSYFSKDYSESGILLVAILILMVYINIIWFIILKSKSSNYESKISAFAKNFSLTLVLTTIGYALSLVILEFIASITNNLWDTLSCRGGGCVSFLGIIFLIPIVVINIFLAIGTSLFVLKKFKIIRKGKEKKAKKIQNPYSFSNLILYTVGIIFILTILYFSFFVVFRVYSGHVINNEIDKSLCEMSYNCNVKDIGYRCYYINGQHYTNVGENMPSDDYYRVIKWKDYNGCQLGSNGYSVLERMGGKYSYGMVTAPGCRCGEHIFYQ